MDVRLLTALQVLQVLGDRVLQWLTSKRLHGRSPHGAGAALQAQLAPLPQRAHSRRRVLVAAHLVPRGARGAAVAPATLPKGGAARHGVAVAHVAKGAGGGVGVAHAEEVEAAGGHVVRARLMRERAAPLGRRAGAVQEGLADANLARVVRIAALSPGAAAVAGLGEGEALHARQLLAPHALALVPLAPGRRVPAARER